MAAPKERTRSGVREAWSIVVLAVAILLVLSLLSYDWQDVSVLQSPPNDPPCNFIGPAGAWTAFVLLTGLGLVAYVVPVWFLGFGLVMVFRGIAHIRAKLVWAALSLLAVACLLELRPGLWRPVCDALNLDAPGGEPCRLATQWVVAHLLGEMGTGILALALLTVSVVMFFGWDAVQRASREGWAALLTVLERWNEARRARREQARQDSVEARQEEWKRQRLERVVQKPPAVTVRPAAEAKPAAAPEPDEREAEAEPAKPPAPVPAPAAAPAAAEKPPARKPAPPPRKDEKPRVLDPVPGTIGGAPYRLPPITLLNEVPPAAARAIRGDTEVTGRIIVETLADFGIKAEVKNFESGPTVTRYELLPAAGVRVEKIAGLSNNLALSLKATSVRVQAPIPGKGMVGVEVPNSTASVVYLRELLEGPEWKPEATHLPLVLGKDVGGNDIVADLANMPHLLIAGATGSGKTVCMNSVLAGLFMARTPAELRLLLIDPKRVEFSAYNNLPHLLGARNRVITDPKKVSAGLRWAINEMEKRYRIMAKAGVRNIQAYNRRKVEKQPDLFGSAEADPLGPLPEKLPYIVIVVDELADLMMTAQAEIENYIARLAQLSRAVGIHMILATQRPSVNVITGTIKANFPSRIAFQVAAKVDSRTILDANGADKLLGRGDMLFLPPGSSKLVRAQGALTTDEEIHRIVDFIKAQFPPPVEDEPERPAVPRRPAAPAPAPVPVVEPPEPSDGSDRSDKSDAAEEAAPPPSRPAPAPRPSPVLPAGGELSFDDMLESSDQLGNGDEDNELLEAAVDIIRETRRASTSSLQRRLRIGYTRAARIMDVLEERGVVGPARGSDPREILMDLDGEMPERAPSGGEEDL